MQANTFAKDKSINRMSVPVSIAVFAIQVLRVLSGELVPSGDLGRHAGKHVQRHWLLVGIMPGGDGVGDRSSRYGLVTVARFEEAMSSALPLYLLSYVLVIFHKCAPQK